MKPAFWIVTRNNDGRVLCLDKRFRWNAGDYQKIKTYRRLGNARRHNPEHVDTYTFKAVYEGDSIDCCGQIERSRS